MSERKRMNDKQKTIKSQYQTKRRAPSKKYACTQLMRMRNSRRKEKPNRGDFLKTIIQAKSGTEDNP